MLVDAIDGDYVPMMLLHLENAACASRSDAICGRSPSTASASARRLTRRLSYEYVHVNRLAADLCHDLAPCMPGRRSACRLLALFAILTGCDYTQGHPHRGAHPRLIEDEDDTHEQDVAAIALTFAQLYTLAYERRVCVRVQQSALQPGTGPAERIMRGVKLHGSMTAGTAAKLPAPAYIMSNASNALWTLLYWIAEHHHPDPYSKTYGYKREDRRPTRASAGPGTTAGSVALLLVIVAASHSRPMCPKEAGA
eukprot:763338-Hanusia_phi.AAC.5